MGEENPTNGELGIMLKDLTREVRDGFSRMEQDVKERVARVEVRVSETEQCTKDLETWKEKISGGLKLTGVIAVPILIAVIISIVLPNQ